jgi:hypothetical protein
MAGQVTSNMPSLSGPMFALKTVRRGLTTSVVLAPVFALAGAVAFVNPSAQLERGLSFAAAAEARLMAAANTVRPATALASRSYEEGSEGFWLTRAPDAENIARVAWTAPVAAGDRVVVNFSPSDREIIDVVAVEEAGGTTRIDTGDGRSARFDITGRRVDKPDSGMVRLSVDAEGRGLTTITQPRDRAL